MSEEPISISNLNDFIFCPVSIFFHALDYDTERMTYQDSYQINGTAAHEKSDNGTYSTRKNVLQAIPVYCEKYNIIGKIDVFDADTGILTERKKKITVVYDGYIFQLYAQYFALKEMGYDVGSMRLYSMDDNRVYNIELPETDTETLNKFEKVISDMNNFNIDNFSQTNESKCKNCIYEPLCSFSALKTSI